MANQFVHVELSTSDLGKAKEFYGSLFDWKLEDIQMPDGTYTMIDVGDEGTGGGMMTHPMPGAPSMWMPYALVTDLEASTAKAQSLGGTIIRGVTEVPNMGAFSIIQDPTGAIIGLWQNKGGG